ncbi:MAG: phage tail sheath N-terminal beta-sandwich domain-containing protein, partial [Bacillota bacterium]
MPVLPGLYLNFRAQALAAIRPGSRGVVAVPVKAHWGPVRQFVEITSEAGITDSYTADESGGATAYAILRLALLGGAKKVLAYRLAGTSAAKASTVLKDGLAVDVLTLTALYEGTRGNGFKVTVRDNPVDPANKKDILLYEGTVLLRTFTFAKGASIVDNAVAAINSDTGNRWITAAKLADGNGTLADVAGQAFAGGDSGIAGVQASDYTNWLAALETQVFDLLALDGVADSAIQTSVIA